jgi:hypothetical protein
MCVLFVALSMTATKTYKDTFDNMLLKCLALSSLSYQKRHIRLHCPSACLLNIDDVVSLSLRLPNGRLSRRRHGSLAALEVVSTQSKETSIFRPTRTALAYRRSYSKDSSRTPSRFVTYRPGTYEAMRSAGALYDKSVKKKKEDPWTWPSMHLHLSSGWAGTISWWAFAHQKEMKPYDAVRWEPLMCIGISFPVISMTCR